MSEELFQVDRVQLVNSSPHLKAFASLKIANAFIVQNLKVIEGTKGLFVAMPQERGKDENDDKYYDTAFPITGKYRKEISALVLEAYRERERQEARA